MPYNLHDAEDFTLDVGNTTSNGISGTGTNPQIAYFNGTNTITSDAVFERSSSPDQIRISDALFFHEKTLTAADNVLECARFSTGFTSGNFGRTVYAGISIVSQDITGVLTNGDGYWCGIFMNQHVRSPNINCEPAGAMFFINQHGIGSVFGVDIAAYSAPDADGHAPNLVGGQVGIHNDYNNGANVSLEYGWLVNQSSTGRANSTPDNCIGLQVQRDPYRDYGSTGVTPADRNVNVTNGVATVQINNGNWLTLGQTYDIDIAGKKISLPNGVYTIQSVDSAAQITLTGVYTGPTLNNQAFVVRVTEPFGVDLRLVRTSRIGIDIQPDPMFPPPPSYYAIQLRDGNANVISGLNWGGNTFFTSLNLTGSAPTAPPNTVSFGADVQATIGAAGGAAPLPGAPTGYLVVNIAGADYAIPYWPRV